MISYQWDSQTRAIQLRDKLKEEGYNVWMDIEQMGGDTLACMADAVENAEVVLFCISKKYQESRSCKSEAEYAYHKNKKMIPLKVEETFDPSGWLGLVVGTDLYYCAHTTETLDKEFPNLVRMLGDRGRTAKKAKWSPVHKGSKALECSICLERFKNPKTLPCMHSFCKGCLIRLAPLGTKIFSCPLCRKRWPVPDGGVTRFQTNFQLKELVDEEASRQQQLTGGGVEFPCTCCDVGKQTRVVAKCHDCKLFICNSGLSAHEHFPGLVDHKVLVFEEHSDANPGAEMTAEANAGSELHIKDWEVFDEMYNEEHSTHLFRYWIQLHGGDSEWQTAMVSHYSTCLTDLHESGMISEDLLAKRQQQVARVFKQAGQYDHAVELVEKALEMERKELGDRPENMSDLYYLAADIYKEILNSINLSTGQDPALVRKLIKYARCSLKFRKKLQGDDNQFELGKVLQLLSGTLMLWTYCGGDSILPAEDARNEAKKYIDEAIQIFTQLKAKGNVAKAIANKANLTERGSEDREKLYREALAMCEEAYGDSSVLSGNLNRAIGVVYEDRQDYHEAYKWFLKCYNVREKIFGEHHPHTRQIYEELNNEFYEAIKKEVELAN